MAYDLADLKSRADAAALAAGIPASLFENLIGHESGWNPDKPGKAGEIGLVQIMPATAAGYAGDAHNIDDNLMMGAQFLKAKFDQYGNWVDALGAYNGSKGTPTGQTYASAILQGLDPKTGQAVQKSIWTQIGDLIAGAAGATSIAAQSATDTAQGNPTEADKLKDLASPLKPYLTTGAMYAGTGVFLLMVLLLGMYLTAAGAKDHALKHSGAFL